MEEAKIAKTWNGANSYATLFNPLVELFFKSVRNVECKDYRCIDIKESAIASVVKSDSKTKTLEEYFDEAWKVDPLRTLKFLFYLRDCRKGKGEKKLFRALVRHMREQGLSSHLKHNIKHIPFYGSWKDISVCFFGTPFEKDAISLISDQLKLDINTDTPSLCAKYAPSEKGAISRKHNATQKIARHMGISVQVYRKKYLVPLRDKLNIVEKKMCAKQWSDINYETVPSIANIHYNKAFIKHDNDRHTQYLRNVMLGKTKMNTKVLMPYQIISGYINGALQDETIEAQWKSFIDDRRSKFTAMNILPLIDVSGSMNCGGTPKPIEVALSLGILFSLLNTTEHYKGKFITFSASPELLSISTKGTSLHDQVNYISKTSWEMTTDFQKVFDMILNVAKTFSLTEDQMPKTLLVLSDMQFDSTGSETTNWEMIETKYLEAGFIRPTIIFWNLNGKSVDFPVPNSNVPNCVLISGFNDSVMYSVLDGKQLSPIDLVHCALDNERYNNITLAP